MGYKIFHATVIMWDQNTIKLKKLHLQNLTNGRKMAKFGCLDTLLSE